MPDEHASEFAETLAGLKSGDAESSDSEKPEFADAILSDNVDDPTDQVEDPKKRLKKATLALVFSLILPWWWTSGFGLIFSIFDNITYWGDYISWGAYVFILFELSPFVFIASLGTCWLYTENDEQFYAKIAKIHAGYFGIVLMWSIWHMVFEFDEAGLEFLLQFPGFVLAGLSSLILVPNLIPWERAKPVGSILLFCFLALAFHNDPEDFIGLFLGDDW
jgi:hypothetical protein